MDADACAGAGGLHFVRASNRAAGSARVMTPDAETLVLQSQQGPAATYTRSGTTSATPHREIQARVLMAPATLRSLQAAINVQLARVDQGGVTV